MTKKEFVSMSLPYGLKVLIPESNKKYCRKTVIGTIGVVFDDGSINCYDTINASPDRYKPILHKLTDISKLNRTVTENFLSDAVIDLMDIEIVEETSITAFELILLVRNHFDVAGLIAKGQAIDVNTLNINPYKIKKHDNRTK